MPATVELFFDPVCPFCWLTSRWIEEVRRRIEPGVTYRPISLRMLNPDVDADGPMGALHGRGLELLRVVAAVDQRYGDEQVAQLYTALGQAIHGQPTGADVQEFEDVARAQLARPADLPGLLAGIGLPTELADAVRDEGYDDAIHRSTELALERVGGDVGTPVSTFDPPDGPSFFGPILSELPVGDEAVRLFEATRVLAEHRPFTEFKRSLRAMPDVPALAGLR